MHNVNKEADWSLHVPIFSSCAKISDLRSLVNFVSGVHCLSLELHIFLHILPAKIHWIKILPVMKKNYSTLLNQSMYVYRYVIHSH